MNIELIGLIGFIVALQAFLHQFTERNNVKQLKKLTKEIKVISEVQFIQATNHKIYAKTFRDVSAFLDLYGSLLDRIFKESNSKIKDKVSEEIKRFNFMLEQSIHELNLICDDQTKRLSSVRALAERFGDASSLNLLRTCNSELCDNKDIDLLQNIKVLEYRLNSIG